MEANKANILMVYPSFPPTYWGFQFVAPLLGKKTSMPPLGLLTIAALTPEEYPIRLVDLNCESLTDDDILWADMVCFSAMLPQKSSLFEIAQRCKAAGKLVVFGGPYPTACPEECIPHADVLVLNEGEITWVDFMQDYASGNYKPLYTSTEKPDVTLTPVPRFDLLKIQNYISVPLQYSRGCPFLCEFCDIIVMFGRKPRLKTPEQMIAEIEALHKTGYRGGIFIVDDNFIGNKKEVKKFLEVLIDWNAVHDSPFYFGTEASVNLADDEELITLMVKSNFLWVFLGIETPVLDSLKETLKMQNLKGSLADKVALIQRAGMQVYGGFMVGFDHDPPDIFERQVKFIEEVAISNAMIGPVVALPGTPLYTRMQESGRLIETAVGDEERAVASGYTNIATLIPAYEMLTGQRYILQSLYTPEAYFQRQLESLIRLPYPKGALNRLKRTAWLLSHLKISFGPTHNESFLSFIKKLVAAYAQIPGAFLMTSLRFAWKVLRNCPDQLVWIPTSIIMGYHFYRFTDEYAVPGLTKLLEQEQLASK